MPAAGALQQRCPHRPRFVVPASRTTKTLRPAELTQILSTGLLGGETRLELGQIPRIIFHFPDPTSCGHLSQVNTHQARKHYTAEEKVAILRRHVVDNERVSKLCDEPALQPTAFYRRQKEFFENGAAASGGFIRHRITGIGPRWIFSVTFVKLEVFHIQEDRKNHEMGIYLTQVLGNSPYMLWSSVARVAVPPTSDL